MKIAIATPTGHIGRRLSEILLEKGQELTLLARNPEKLQEFAQKGAKIPKGFLDDQAYLTEATKGVDALFWLTPPDYQSDAFRDNQNKLGKAAALAIGENKIPLVVNLSSIGAQHDSGTGPVAGLHDVEKLLEEAGENITHLRAAYFYENYFLTLESIKAQGKIYLPVPGTLSRAMIGTSDIAQVAADALLKPEGSGRKVIELEGPDTLTFATAAERIGKGTGKPVEHVEVSEDQARSAMTQMGLSESVAELMLELYRGFKNGQVAFEGGGNTHLKTTTPLEQFAREVLKPALGA